MTAPATTLELITSYINDIAPVNPIKAARLSEFVVRFSAFEDTFNAYENKVIQLRNQRIADVGLQNDNELYDYLSQNQEIIDLNQQARDAAFAFVKSPLDVYGAVKFTSSLLLDTKITANAIGFAAGNQAASPVFDLLLKTLVWDGFAVEVLPPFEQGTNDGELFIGNLNGGTVELLGGNDIFIPNVTNETYIVKGGAGDNVIILNDWRNKALCFMHNRYDLHALDMIMSAR